MRARVIVLVALAAAVTVASVAAAGGSAQRQRVAIELKILPEQTFTLNVLYTGPLLGDLGKITTVSRVLTMRPRNVMRDGQAVSIFYPTIWTFAGKRGTLTIRERSEWVSVGNGDDRVAFGTWSVVRGTGQYAGVSGGGRSGHAGLGEPWYARYEGFLTQR
jgi:hypothetical protein